MAKRRKEKTKLDSDGLAGIIAPRYYEFELQSGHVITYRPLNPDLVQAIREMYPNPEPPMREIPTVAGDVDLEPDVNDPGYLVSLSDVNRERGEAMLRLLAVQALEHIEPPDGWIEKQKWIFPDWEPPAGPLDQKVYWIEHWLITNPLDLSALVQAAAMAAALTPEEVTKALRSFRSQMARAISDEVGATILSALDEFRVGDHIGERVGEDTAAGVSEAAEAVAG